MKRLLIAITFLLVCGQITSAQDIKTWGTQINGLGNADNLEGLQNLGDVRRYISFEQRTQNEMKKSKLNYYLDETWQGGVYYTKSNAQINGLLFRYNIYTDQIELRSVINKETMDIVSIGSKKFVYSQFFNEDSVLSEGYFELIVNGDCKLLLRRSIVFKDGNNEFAYGVASSTNVTTTFYIKKNNEAAVIINKSKNSIKNILSDKSDFVDYIDDRMLLLITDKKLIEIINYYNSI